MACEIAADACVPVAATEAMGGCAEGPRTVLVSDVCETVDKYNLCQVRARAASVRSASSRAHGLSVGEHGARYAVLYGEVARADGASVGGDWPEAFVEYNGKGGTCCVSKESIGATSE